MAVASGDLRRRKEAMDHLVIDISKGDEEHISSAIRIAIEVISTATCSLIHIFYYSCILNDLREYLVFNESIINLNILFL